MADEPIELNAAELRQKLNLETGKLTWQELERHFARGVVIVADSQLDLIEVAAGFAEDNKAQIENWINQGQLTRANDEHAIHWTDSQPLFWSVVVAPWVIVQEIPDRQT